MTTLSWSQLSAECFLFSNVWLHRPILGHISIGLKRVSCDLHFRNALDKNGVMNGRRMDDGLPFSLSDALKLGRLGKNTCL